MNNKLRNEIIAIALQKGVSHTQQVIEGNTIDDYEGSALVALKGKQYSVKGRAAKYHSMAYTNGYVNISCTSICTGLRG